MNPDDFEAVNDECGGVTAEIDTEGVVRIPLVPRGSLVVIQVEMLERMLTHVFSEGLSRQ
jgi:hypothetical protein